MRPVEVKSGKKWVLPVCLHICLSFRTPVSWRVKNTARVTGQLLTLASLGKVTLTLSQDVYSLCPLLLEAEVTAGREQSDSGKGSHRGPEVSNLSLLFAGRKPGQASGGRNQCSEQTHLHPHLQGVRAQGCCISSPCQTQALSRCECRPLRSLSTGYQASGEWMCPGVVLPSSSHLLLTTCETRGGASANLGLVSHTCVGGSVIIAQPPQDSVFFSAPWPFPWPFTLCPTEQNSKQVTNARSWHSKEVPEASSCWRKC